MIKKLMKMVANKDNQQTKIKEQNVIQKEYYNYYEITKMYNLQLEHCKLIAQYLFELKDEVLLKKDSSGEWLVHCSLLDRLNPANNNFLKTIKMEQKQDKVHYEYKTTNEVSELFNLTPKRITQIAQKLIKTGEVRSKQLLGKDRNGHWYIHHSIVNKFKQKNKKHLSEYAFTIDPCSRYFTQNDLQKIVEYVTVKMRDRQPDFRISYTIEAKTSGSKNLHIHGYTNAQNTKHLKKEFKDCFVLADIDMRKMYNKEGWEKYITKEDKVLKRAKPIQEPQKSHIGDKMKRYTNRVIKRSKTK